MKKTLFLLFAAMASAVCSLAIERPLALLLGKQLVLTTTAGKTFHYVVSSLDMPMLYRLGDSLVVEGDTFLISQVKALRFQSMKHYLLDEDSVTYGANYAVDHGMLAFRRTLQTGQWNSLTVPFDLTGKQVREMFGEDARLAVVSKLREADEASVEFATVDLSGNQQAIKAGSHYLLWPTREPDYSSTQRMPSQWTSTRAYGPVYLMPLISMDSNQKPATQNLYNKAYTQHVFINGTYKRLDDSDKVGSVIKNKKLEAGLYTFNETGHVKQNQEATMLQAFRSWFKDLSDEKTKVHFYINGIEEDLLDDTNGIDAVAASLRHTNDAVYDLSGRRVGAVSQMEALPKGIYIVNGRKQIVK